MPERGPVVLRIHDGDAIDVCSGAFAAHCRIGAIARAEPGCTRLVERRARPGRDEQTDAKCLGLIEHGPQILAHRIVVEGRLDMLVARERRVSRQSARLTRRIAAAVGEATPFRPVCSGVCCSGDPAPIVECLA
jgi:hypothetical protein